MSPFPTRPDPRFSTHEVLNQPAPFEDVDLFSSDRALCEGVAAYGADWARDRLEAFGALAGSAGFRELGRLANRHLPELHTHDRFGHRVDEVEYHPAWHDVMRAAMAHGVHNLPWTEARPGAQVARSALHSMLSQVESGACCPLTMTFACFPVVAQEPALAARLERGLLDTRYEPGLRPIETKGAILVGMAMTEKQGGSDVRSNTTAAHALDGDGTEVELIGHKWFCSAPMSDGFLTLAKRDGEGAPTCYFVPRVLEDGTRNAIRIQRLKDKLGNRSNASSEIEYAGARATRVGPEGRGIATILEMVQHTRLDCVSGSTGLMRQALAQALHHASYREVFGRRLADQPMMQSVLADLALEVEGATALMLRLASAFDRAPGDAGERAFARLATAVGKYWVCKRAPSMIYEAMECLGGPGYVEESILPRLFREAPVNAIWEGSGNVMCLDVLRAIVREPESLAAVRAELEVARGGDRRLDEAIARITSMLEQRDAVEAGARVLVEELAIALQAGLLLRHAPTAVAEAFVAARVAGGGRLFGTLPTTVDVRPILERAHPVPA
ncbi:MAG: isovaleryl-CoA dehydrogenase [Myxococcales bacterium]|nr:isovaleryl-CoA dehydrogenase [Myxococcales bacterium]